MTVDEALLDEVAATVAKTADALTVPTSEGDLPVRSLFANCEERRHADQVPLMRRVHRCVP